MIVGIRKHASVINLQNNCYRLGLHLHEVLYQTKKLLNKAGDGLLRHERSRIQFHREKQFFFLVSKKIIFQRQKTFPQKNNNLFSIS